MFLYSLVSGVGLMFLYSLMSGVGLIFLYSFFSGVGLMVLYSYFRVDYRQVEPVIVIGNSTSSKALCEGRVKQEKEPW